MEQNEEGGYTVTVPSLPGCFSEGSSREEVIAGYIEIAKNLGRPIPVEVSVPVNAGSAGALRMGP